MKLHKITLWLGLIGLLWGMQGCIYRSAEPVATQSADPTQAFETVQAMLTMTSPAQKASPTSAQITALPTTPSPESNTRPTPTRTHSLSPSPTPICDRAAAGSPIDVTIPDDTVLQPGEAFTKIWELENTGSCSWSNEYAAVFLYGEMMSSLQVVPLTAKVEPGQTVQVAVEMIAPIKPGNYQGNWKLQNADGDLFGIGPVGDSPFWVRIMVAEPVRGSPTATRLPTFTPTPTETPLPTFTPSPTPQIAVQSQLTLEVDYLLDLDQAQINPLQGADLAYRTGSITFHWLIPQGDAILGIFGSQLPNLQDCQAATMSAAAIPVESLAPMLYLCYRTSLGQTGRLQLLDLDLQTFKLELDLITWTAP